MVLLSILGVSPNSDTSWAFYSQQQIQFKLLSITYSVTCSHFWDGKANNLLSSNIEYEVINKLPGSKIVLSHSTWKQKTFGIIPCSPLDCWREPKNQRTRYKRSGKRCWNLVWRKSKETLVMETGICFLTWRCHEVHGKAIPGKTLRWQQRESKLKSRKSAHISVLEMALQMLQITLKATVRVWIVFNIEEKWSKARDSLSWTPGSKSSY